MISTQKKIKLLEAEWRFHINQSGVALCITFSDEVMTYHACSIAIISIHKITTTANMQSTT